MTKCMILILVAAVAPSLVWSANLAVPRGLSMVSVPAPPPGYTASQLLQRLNARFVARSKPSLAASGLFEVFIRELGGAGFPIERGRGYVVSLPADTTLDIDSLSTLAVRMVNLSSTTVCRPGTATVQVLVQNTGDTAVGSVTVTPRASPGAGIAFTASGDNPAMLPPGQTADYRFTMRLGAGAATGVTTIDASATGLDASDGATRADLGADYTAPVYVVPAPEPAAVLFVRNVTSWSTTVFRPGTSTVQVAVENTGSSPLRSLLVTPRATPGRGIAFYAAASNPTFVPAGATREFRFTMSADSSAATGPATLDASASAVDTADSGSRTDSASDYPSAVLLTAAPPPPEVLFVRLVTASSTTLARPGTATIRVNVENTGAEPLLGATVTPAATPGTGITYAADGGNPSTLPAGAARDFLFTATLTGAAVTGITTFDAAASAIGGRGTFHDAEADYRCTVLVVPASVQGATLFVRGISVGSTTVFRPGTSPVQVSVENTGTHALQEVAVQPYAAPSAGISFTPLAGNPTAVPAGATLDFRFTMALAAGAATALTTIDASATGLDAIDSGPRADNAADYPMPIYVLPAPLPAPSLFVRTISVSSTTVFRPGTATVLVEVANAGSSAVEQVAVVPRSAPGGGISFVPVPGNPGTIPAESARQFGFTMVLDAGAATAVTTIDASATARSVLDGAARSDEAADHPATVIVSPSPLPGPVLFVRTVSVSSTTVSRPGTAGVQIAVENTGATSLQQVVVTPWAAPSAGITFSASAGNPTGLPPGTSRNFLFTMALDSSAATVATTLDAGVSASDSRDGSPHSDASADHRLTVAVVAASAPGPVLFVRGVSAGSTTIFRPGTSPVQVQLENTGPHALQNVVVKPRCLPPTEASFAAAGDNPRVIPANSSASFHFTLTLGAGAPTGLTTIDASASALDPVDAVTCAVSQAEHPWPAYVAPAPAPMPSLFIRNVLVVPSSFQRPGSSSLSITVENTGGTTLQSVAVSPRATPEVGLTFAAESGNPTAISAGSTAEFRFTVNASAAAATGVTTVDASATAIDSVDSGPRSDLAADHNTMIFLVP